MRGIKGGSEMSTRAQRIKHGILFEECNRLAAIETAATSLAKALLTDSGLKDGLPGPGVWLYLRGKANEILKLAQAGQE